jgi:hypothetical protein
MIYQNAGVGPTTRVARTASDRVNLRKVLGDHLRTSDKKTYLQVCDVKHFPGKPLPLSFFAFQSEWGRSAKEEGFMDAGRSTLAIAEANIRDQPASWTNSLLPTSTTFPLIPRKAPTTPAIVKRLCHQMA